MRSTLRLFLLLFCGFAAVTALNWWLGWFEVDDARAFLQSARAHPWQIGLAVVALLAVDSLLSVPTMATAALAGYLLGAWRGGLCSSLGVLAAGTICYAVAWTFRHQRTLTDVPGVGPRALLLSRALPMLPEVLSALAGATGMPYRRYLLWFTLGNVPFVVAAAIAGSVSGPDEPWPAVATAIRLPTLAALAYVAARPYSTTSRRTPK